MCCKAVAVVQLSKATGDWCPHVCPECCGIYETRPIECCTFRCLWLNGYFSDDERPDRIDVVFFEEETAEGECIVTASESHPGAAADSPRAKNLIRQILEAGVSVVVRNRFNVARACPDGRIAHFHIDQSDPLRAKVVDPTACADGAGEVPREVNPKDSDLSKTPTMPKGRSEDSTKRARDP